MRPEPYKPKHLLRVVHNVAWLIFAFCVGVAFTEASGSVAFGLIASIAVGYLYWVTAVNKKASQDHQ